MFFQSNSFRMSALIFLLVTTLMMLIQPSLFFNQEGKIKDFGVNYTENTTPLPLILFLYILLIGVYLLMVSIGGPLNIRI